MSYRYCEERPLLLGNVGMSARLCTYYQKKESNDLTVTSLGNTAHKTGMGTLLALEPSDKSPFLGDISPGQTQSCLETNMYRAPVFPHKLASTDYLLVRSAKGSLSLRRVNRLYVVGQQVTLFNSYALKYKTTGLVSARELVRLTLNLVMPNCRSRLLGLDNWVHSGWVEGLGQFSIVCANHVFLDFVLHLVFWFDQVLFILVLLGMMGPNLD